MPVHRTFVAVEIPEDVRRSIGEIQKRIAGPGLRMVDPSHMHLTVKFIGDWEESALGDLCAAVGRAAAASAPFEVLLRGVGAFPNLSRPHVIYLKCEDRPGGSFRRLHEAVETGLEALGIRRERRGFTPHLTLARVKADRTDPGLAGVLERFEAYETGTAEASELAVILSELTRDGPV
ncbi:MAG: RNA 2',3'-cyclic phosphodiesterase, partial [Planctomycetes bacterium]|nr:RNA 2',3'-cyclic phosphodiesterase [Planctomycetota bacterium]